MFLFWYVNCKGNKEIMKWSSITSNCMLKAQKRILESSHGRISNHCATQAKNSLDPALLLKDQPPNFYAPQFKKN